ncbi:MAG: hypothetical protein DRP45_10975 [Candidatus Zixiibacteriota bacterium]|nr:MAG: hypothetical protein DRP45_10975 [candidate division Zixibacteria bacterium]
MISGLERVTARRAWFVPNFVVWGLPVLGEHEFVVLEDIDSTYSIHYGSTSIGQSDQEVSFDQLTDHRGNSLPMSLASPRVFPRAKGSEPVFVVGKEAASSFKIARDPDCEGTVTVDLLIMEMGD